MRRAALLAIVLASCATPPAEEKPELPFRVPERWTTPAPPGDSPEAWWRAFGDPSLEAVLKETLEHNLSLQAAAARVDAAEAQARIAGASMWPQLNASGSASRRAQVFVGLPIPGAEVATSRATSLGVSLDLSWEIDLWGRLRAGQSAALADAQAAEAEYAAAKLSLLGQTAKTWFAAIEAERQLALARRTVESFRATQERVEERFRRGVRPAVDVRLARAQLAAAESVLEQRAQALDRVRRQLELLLGRYPSAEIRAGADLPRITAAVPAGLPSELLSRRADLAAAERRLAGAGRRVDEAHLARLPSLRLTASGGTASNALKDLVDGDFSVWSIAAGIVQPILQGGRLAANADLAEANRAQLLAQFVETALRAYAEVEGALAAEQYLARAEDAQARAAEESRQAAALAEERYAAGLADILTLLSSQRQAFEAEAQLLALRRLRIETRIDLHLALGGGFRR